ncbi:MAG: ATP-binding protein [Ruminococcaceae bacterium]|nr:ATP-binding protein [Oscillospiraceae bacterium]
MVILITGASHTGKTLLAQRLLERYGYPYLSIDHLKMGLIRSGHTDLTPMSDDDALTSYLWPIVREIVKTAVENGQDLIIEGCYIPFDWAEELAPDYLAQIRCVCLVMTEGYIRQHFDDIRAYASVIEQRLDDSDCTMESLIADNAKMLARARAHGMDVLLIDGRYDVSLEL